MQTLSKRFFNIWVDMKQAGKLEEIAGERRKDVADVVQDIISPVLEGQDEDGMGQFVLLRIPARAYKIHLKWFDGDVELTRASMVGSIENAADDFAEALRKSGGT